MSRGRHAARGLTALVLLAVPVFLFFKPLMYGHSVVPTDAPYFVDPVFMRYRPAGLRSPSSLLTAGDEVLQFYVWRVLSAEAMRDGRIALWNPYSGCGAPLLANDQSSQFHPLNFMGNLCLPPLRATLLFMVLSGLLTSWWMYLFIRDLGGCRAGALGAGIAFAYGGFMLAWQGRPQAGTAMWVPLILLATRRLVDRPSRAWFACAAVSLGCQFLGGHIKTSLHVLELWVAWLFALALWRARERGIGEAARSAALAVGALAVGLALGSGQLLPTTEYVRQSVAPGAYQMRLSVPILPAIYDGIRGEWGRLMPLLTVREDITCLISPGFFGSHARNDYWRLSSNELEQCLYLGLLPILALCCRSRGREERFFTWVSAVALGAAVSAPIVHLLNTLPVLATYPGPRYRLVFCVAAATVFGLRVQHLFRSPGSRRAAITYAAATVIASYLALRGIQHIQAARISHTLPPAPAFRWLPLLVPPAVGMAAVVLVLWGWRRRHFRVPAAVVAGLAVLDVLTYAGFFRVSTPAVWADHPPPEVEWLASDRSASRITGGQWAVLTPNSSAVFGIADTRAFDGLTVGRYARLTRAAFSGETRMYRFGEVSPQGRIVDLLGVRHLLMVTGSAVESPLDVNHWRLVQQDPLVTVFENRRVLPRAFVVGRATQTVGEEAALKALLDPAFDPTAVVTVEAPVAAHPGGAGRGEPVETLQRGDHRIELQADGPGILVITDSFYPGWRAVLDGKVTPLFPADFAFRGISLAPGRHNVVLYYEPGCYRIGVFVSLAALALVAALLACGRCRAPDRRQGC